MRIEEIQKLGKELRENPDRFGVLEQRMLRELLKVYRERPPIAEALRTARIEKGLTQQQAAEELGVFITSVTRWELGTRVPSPAMILRLKRWGVAL